jgi:hypothetical protein
MINKENIEEYILQLVDGELDSKTHAAVMQYVASHKEAADLLAEYEACKLMTDETLLYENKLELYAIANVEVKTEKKKRALWMPLSIAASVAALIIIALVVNNKNTSIDVAQTATPQVVTPTTTSTINSEVSNNTENTVVSVATENKKIEAEVPVRIDVLEKSVKEQQTNNTEKKQNIAFTKEKEEQEEFEIQAKNIQVSEVIATTKEITELKINIPQSTNSLDIKIPKGVQIQRITPQVNFAINENSMVSNASTPTNTSSQTKNSWLSKNIAFKKLVRAKETATEILASVNDVRKDGIVIDLDYSGLTRKHN